MMSSFINAEFCLCNSLLTDLQSTHSKNLVYDTLKSHTDITVLSVPATLALFVQVHEKEKRSPRVMALTWWTPLPGSLQLPLG